MWKKSLVKHRKVSKYYDHDCSGNCKALVELFQNSAAKGKDHANSKLKNSESGVLCSNELLDCSDIISSTSEGDNLTP